MAAACTFVVCCTPYHLTLLAWKQFDNSYGHEPGLADGQGTTAAVLGSLELQHEFKTDCDLWISPH